MSGLCFAGKKGHLNTLQCVMVTPVKAKLAPWAEAEQSCSLWCTCLHQDFSSLGCCGGTFGCGHPEPTGLLLWQVPGSDAGCRHCWQCGHLLGWGCDPDLVVVLSRARALPFVILMLSQFKQWWETQWAPSCRDSPLVSGGLSLILYLLPLFFQEANWLCSWELYFCRSYFFGFGFFLVIKNFLLGE